MPEITIKTETIEAMMDQQAKMVAIAVLMFSNGIDHAKAEEIYRQFLKRVIDKK